MLRMHENMFIRQRHWCLEIEVCDVNKIEAYVLVSVAVKVMLCERPSNIGSKRKHNVTVSYHTGSCCVYSCGRNILNWLKEGKSYILESFRIGEHHETKNLALCKEGSKDRKVVEAVEPIIIMRGKHY